jgi:SAM-dependent methyltransferase
MSGAGKGLYAISFQASLTPGHFALAAAMAGHVWRPRADLTLVDLGCGRGYAAMVLAAANPGWRVVGIDRDPAAIAEARMVAAAAGLANALFLEADLAALGTDLPGLPPQIDVAVAHGVWSWIPDAARDGIRDLLAQRLKPGGLACFGYNALPAARREQRLQRALRLLAEGGDDVAAATRAMARLREAGTAAALGLTDTPMLSRLLADPPLLEPAFVAHEFLTAHWRPVFHDELVSALAPCKLDFLASCNLFEAVPWMFLDAGPRALLEEFGPAAGREALKDLFLPRDFRTDLFVRGARRGPPARALSDIVLALAGQVPATPPELPTGTAIAALKPRIWAPIVEALERGPTSLAALCAAAPADAAPRMEELAALLVDTGIALPVFASGRQVAPAARFNRIAAEAYSQGGTAPGHFALAAAACGGGVPVDAATLWDAADNPDRIAAATRARWRQFGALD